MSRTGIRVWGNAERLPEEGYRAIRAVLRAFDVVEWKAGALNIEHEGLTMDEDVVAEAAAAIAGALSPTGFGQLDLIDHNEEFVLRFSIEPGSVKSRKTGHDNMLEKYHQER